MTTTTRDNRADRRFSGQVGPAGFADRAHLVREWREFTGHTRAAWRRSEAITEFAS